MGDLYEIRVKGHLDGRWAHQLGMSMALLPNGETALSGEVKDQAALHSLLSRIRDLGLTLLLVRHIDQTNGTNGKVITTQGGSQWIPF